MNEWHQFLQQTHPDFQPIQKAEDKPELEWISPLVKLQNQITSIPDKMAFKIGEVADLVGVKQYVLRYWESEFDGLHPKKSKNGQRMYSRRDVETALLIRKLLHEDRFSIEGARTALKKLKKQIREKDKVEAQAPVVEATASVTETTSEVLQSTQDLMHSAKEILAAVKIAKSKLNI